MTHRLGAFPKRASLFLGVLAGLAASLTPTSAPAGHLHREEQIATAVQLALPLAAGVCAIRQNRGKDFLAAFAVETVTVQGLKYGLGSAPINRRPNGGRHGFPSGHSALAMLGATDLAWRCLPDRPVPGALAYGTALAVAASRLHTGDHDVTQVLTGLAVGDLADGISVSAGKGFVGLGYQMSF